MKTVMAFAYKSLIPRGLDEGVRVAGTHVQGVRQKTSGDVCVYHRLYMSKRLSPWVCLSSGSPMGNCLVGR